LLFGIILKEEGGEQALEQHTQELEEAQPTQKPMPNLPQPTNHTPTSTQTPTNNPPQTKGTPPAVKPSVPSNGGTAAKGTPPAMKRGNAPPGPKRDGGGPPIVKSTPIGTTGTNSQAKLPAGDIFSEIQGGNFNLTSAKERKIVNELPEEEKGLTGALSDALKNNRVFLSGGLDNNDDDESSDWD